jgi:TolC family type I secretion outer membrane protein
MKFFLFFLFFYFNTSYLDFFNNFYDLRRDNVLFSNNIRLNIDKIPYRSYLIIKKFDVAKFNFKQKPKLSNNFSANYTDSEIDNIKTEENLVLANAPFLNEVNDDFFNNNPLLKKNENTYSSKNFKQIVNNLEDNNNKEPFVDLNILETINKAINYNPKIKAQKSSYESSKENIKQVYSGIFPSIEMNLSKGYKDRDSSSSVQTTKESTSPQDFSINLEQTLYTGGKFTAEANKAKSQLLIEEENLRLIRYEVILESALSYLNVLEKKKLIELNNLKEEKFKNSFESIELLVKVGSASQSDLVFAQSKLVQIAAEKIVSINEFNITKANYKKIVGELLPNGNLEEPKINKINFPDNFDNALDIAFKNNPKIKIAELEENIAKFDVKSQFAELMPNITLDGEYQSTEDTASKGSYSDTTEITAKITVPLFKGGKNFSKIKQAKIIAKKVRYELENKRNEVTETVTKSWTYFQTSETLLKAANINIEARKLMLEGIEHEVKLGIKSYIDLLQSKEDLIDAEFNKITAIKNYIISALQLKADIGELSLKDLYI